MIDLLVEENRARAETGLPVSRTVDLAIDGMTCASCVARVEKSLRKVDGVEDVAVNLATNRARVRMLEAVDTASLQDRVERAGYHARPVEREDAGELQRENEQHVRDLRRRFIIAAPFALVVLVISMLPMIVPSLMDFSMKHVGAINYLQLLLTSVVMFYCGRDFFTIAWRNVRHLTADMNTLVAVGTGAAYIFSLVLTVSPGLLPGVPSHEVYFDTAAVVIALVLMGRWLEGRAKSSTSDSIRRLMQLSPNVAHRVSHEDPSRIDDVEVDFITTGDHLLVRPGEGVPVDGMIVDGASAIDESTMTGESMPVEKGAGDRVLAGTLNATGSFTMVAQEVGDQTAIASIIQTVRDAQASKAPIQRLADRVAAIFVPVVIGIGLLTFFGWLLIGDAPLPVALVNSVAVLVIACPCAMGLAVPTAVIAATGNGAERGILIKNAESLERAGQIDVVAFDKTGTLTEGKPQVLEVYAAPDADRDEIIRLAASLEVHSEHPIALAIVRYAKRAGHSLSPVASFSSEPGVGASGIVEGKELFIGKPGTSHPGFEVAAHAGATVVHIFMEGRVVGAVVLADRVKQDAREVIERLHRMNVRSVMITGDAGEVAEFVARELSIDEAIAGVRPQEKGEKIADLMRQGSAVAMVGDGVNDAPALAVADLGIAMGTGADVAMATADITILGGEIRRVPEAIELSKMTMRIIRQNLFWAFIYNVIGIPLAAFGLLDPMIAGAAMALSSVSVVTNSLRLKRVGMGAILAPVSSQ